MADDDIDLDAMLDSALDEGLAATTTDEPAEVELDLDSMLDDALGSVAVDTAGVGNVEQGGGAAAAVPAGGASTSNADARYV